MVDQLDCAALLSFDLLARRVQEIIDVDAQARNPKWTIARRFKGASGIDDGVDSSLWAEGHRRVRDERLLRVQTTGMRA